MRSSEIALLIPHYNNLKGLEKTLSSISNEEPLDIIIVDDGSDKKPNLKALEKKFPSLRRVVVIYLERNMGIDKALNEGLKYILKHKYKYVARCDCGDLNAPGRFKIQKEFLENNPEVCLVGSWVHFISPDGEINFSFKPPTTHEKIKKYMFINSAFIHPAVMFKTDIIKHIGFYPEDVKGAEDYAFFFKVVKSCRTANIPKFLVFCEENPQGISLSNRRGQILSRLKIIIKNFELNIWAIYGLIRNSLLLFLPYRIIRILKSLRGRLI